MSVSRSSVKTPSTASDVYAEFDNAVAENEECPHLFRMKMFCNISCFELRGIKPPSTGATTFGGTSLVYAFYTRLYDRLQKVADHQTEKRARLITGSFFAPFIPDMPALGFLEFLMFCEDFKITPTLISKREIQRTWLSMFERHALPFNQHLDMMSFERIFMG
jgi:hypothetical protein